MRWKIDGSLLTRLESISGSNEITVYKWITEKQMPAHRMGRLWKFRKEEVDEWVRDGKAATINETTERD